VAERENPTSRAERRRRTEARILAAATRLFVESGYERTTIRAVAAEAGVDPGLVMHYFGSKQGLFRQVTRGAVAEPVRGTPDEVVEQILDRLMASLAEEPAQSLAIMRSMLTNPEAAEAAGGGAARHQAQIERSLGEIPAAGTRAALINAVLLGVILSRHLLDSAELRDAPAGEITALLRPCLRSLAGADPMGADRDGAPTG
jgi:AcrR family transcriptional regulator